MNNKQNKINQKKPPPPSLPPPQKKRGANETRDAYNKVNDVSFLFAIL